jgi:uncharacterized protein YndB with AHSA1/START domain
MSPMGETLETAKMDSFQIEQEITIHAPRERVYQALTEEIGDWWAFRIGEDKDTKLRFEPKVGGRFYEDYDNEQGALLGIVNYIKAPVEIRLTGVLGMSGAVTSSYKYNLEEQAGSTVIKLSHLAAGLLRPEWKDSHIHGWQVLLGVCLREHIEKNPDGRHQG